MKHYSSNCSTFYMRQLYRPLAFWVIVLYSYIRLSSFFNSLLYKDGGRKRGGGEDANQGLRSTFYFENDNPIYIGARF
jgi:hypothetical protein